MFEKKPRKTFRISTAHFYVVSAREESGKKMEKLKEFVTRPCYRSAGILVAL